MAGSGIPEANPSLIDYVTDSAASGTGWATGYKTSNGRVSSVAGTGAAVTRFTTILELAQRAGFKTGNAEVVFLYDERGHPSRSASTFPPPAISIQSNSSSIWWKASSPISSLARIARTVCRAA